MRGTADEDDMLLAEQSGMGRKMPNRNSVRFYKRPVVNEARSLEEGRPIFEPVDFVEISAPGDPKNITDKPVNDKIRAMYAAQYQAFLSNSDQDAAAGTLLSAWGVISPERAEELKHFKIRTVEQLSEVSDGNLQSLGSGSRKERDAAKDYIQTMKGAAPVAQLRAQLEEERGRRESLEEQLKELSAKVEAASKQQNSHQHHGNNKHNKG